MNRTTRILILVCGLQTFSSLPVLAQNDEAFCEDEALAAGMVTEEDIDNFVEQCMANIQAFTEQEAMPDSDINAETPAE